MFKLFLAGIVSNLFMLWTLNLKLGNLGEAGSEKQAEQKGGEQKPEPKFTQQDLDKHIQERLARERQKYADYDDLKKFRDEMQSKTQEQELKDLEAKKNYEKALEQYKQKENVYQTQLTQKEQEINNMRVNNSLYNEVMKHSAYPETVDLLRSQAVIDKEGNIKISVKDSNGFDTQVSVEEGVKKFLEQRPYLVKATARAGAGTGSANTNTGNKANRDLAGELQEAMRSGDRKRVNEIKQEIRAKHASLA